MCLRWATRNLFWCSVAWRGCLFVYAESENISRDWCFLILFTHYIHAYIYTQRSIYDCFFYDSASSVALFLNAVAFRKSLEHYEGFPRCFRAGTHFVQRLPAECPLSLQAVRSSHPCLPSLSFRTARLPVLLFLFQVISLSQSQSVGLSLTRLP